MPARDFSRRYSLFYGCLFLGAGVQLPFLPLWLAHKGLDAASIGLVLAAQLAARAVGAPIGAYVADLFGVRRPLMIACAIIGFLLTAMLGFAGSFMSIFVLATSAAVFLAPVFPLGEAAALDGAAHHKLDYGRMRLWGSLSFVAGSLGAGAALQIVPISWAVPIIAAGQGILALACFAIPRDEPQVHMETGPSDAALTVFLSLPFLVFLAATSLGQSSHAILYGFGSLNWDHAGYQKATIALFWAVSIASEVLLFAFSGRIAALLGGVGLVIIGAGVGIVRWPLMSFDAPVAAVIAVQTLHAITFAALHVGTMIYIRETVPQRLRNTAQGLHSAITGGAVMSLAMWASGPLFGALGARAYLAMAAMSAAALGFALLLRRISPRVPAAQAA
jgi:MFS transporter, PPP family, 3-phenylpropionic acid transporter